jgi:streptogramin lyase
MGYRRFLLEMSDMRIKLVFLAAGVAIALVSTFIASASSLALDEADLTPSKIASEINLGSDGYLYVSEDEANRVWKINPSDGNAISYLLNEAGVLDAKSDATGNIWWTDGATTFGHINSSGTLTVTTWQAPEDHNLYGVTFGQDGKVWMTEWFGAASRLYRFDPMLMELCTYTLPLDASSYSYYILHEGGKLWLANWSLDRIYWVDPAGEQATWWQLPHPDALPMGMALDQGGKLWWADYDLHTLNRLDPSLDQMTVYTLPTPMDSHPWMLTLDDGLVWYTEATGTLGCLNPGDANGVVVTLPSTTGAVTKVCTPSLEPYATYNAFTTTKTLSWSQNSLDPILDDQGWLIYQMPAGGEPYGVASGGNYLWLTDQGREKLARFSPPASSYIYLPIIIR